MGERPNNYYNTMKAFLSILSLTFLLTACVPQNQVQVPVPSEDIISDQEEAGLLESDFFADYGLRFSYPEDLVLSESLRENMLLLDTVDRSGYEGDGLFTITSLYVEERNLDELLEELSQFEAYEAVPYEVNGNEFTRVSYNSEFGDYLTVVYYLDLGDAYFLLAPGTEPGDKNPNRMTETTEVILNSVELN